MTGKHGLEKPKGSHGGDLPNLVVKADGTGTVDHTLKHVTIISGKNSLTDGRGTAVVLHTKKDDQKSNPSGGSGERMACGVIVRQ